MAPTRSSGPEFRQSSTQLNLGTLGKWASLLAESALLASSPSSRSRFERQVAFPVATLVALAMLAIVVFVAYSTARQSRDAQDQAMRATRHALETKAEEVARTAQDYASWNDAVRNLDLEFDVTWADNNVGRYIHETFGYDVTFVIGRDDRTRYATIDGELRTADAFELAPGLEHLIARARAISPDQPGAVSAYLMLDGVIAIFGASPITPETTNPIAAPQGPRPVLVYAELLDGDGVLNSIAETLRLHNLHVLPPQAASVATLPLTAPDGTKLGGLAWQPPPLGRELIRDLVPSLLLAFGLIAGFTWFVLNHARKTARTIEAGEARFRDVAEASADWIWETDAKGRLVFVSERFAEVMALTPQTFLMRPFGDLLGNRDDTDGLADLCQAMEARRPFRDLLCRIENGTDQCRVLRFAGKPALDGLGGFHGYRGTASDVTAQIAAEQRAHYLALHDPMTELPNRELLCQRLEEALAGLRRRDSMTAVLMIDLDRFKSVNDTLGHAAGDRLLKLCSRRLEACVRDTDTVARLGGDEFALIQVGVEGAGRRRHSVAACSRRWSSHSSSTVTRSSSRRASAWRLPQVMPRSPAACCNTPMSRCTGPRQRVAIPSAFSSRRWTVAYRRAGRLSATCAPRSSAVSSKSTIRSRLMHGPRSPWASKRSHAGTTPSGAGYRPRNSSRSPRRPASSSSLENRCCARPVPKPPPGPRCAYR